MSRTDSAKYDIAAIRSSLSSRSDSSGDRNTWRVKPGFDEYFQVEAAQLPKRDVLFLVQHDRLLRIFSVANHTGADTKGWLEEAYRDFELRILTEPDADLLKAADKVKAHLDAAKSGGSDDWADTMAERWSGITD